MAILGCQILFLHYILLPFDHNIAKKHEIIQYLQHSWLEWPKWSEEGYFPNLISATFLLDYWICNSETKFFFIYLPQDTYQSS